MSFAAKMVSAVDFLGLSLVGRQHWLVVRSMAEQFATEGGGRGECSAT
jgi:hypothetical protein